MLMNITARHADVPADLKERAQQVLDRLARRATRPTSAHVTFDSGKTGASAEIVLNAARDQVYVAKADAADHRTALDRAIAKLQRQLEKAEVGAARRRRKAATS